MSIVIPREDVKEALLEAAGSCFQRYGYKKTTVEDMAQRAGVCRATVYLHFKSKEEIALNWIARHIETLQAELKVISHEATPPADRLRKMLLARVLLRFDFARPYSQSIDELLAALRPSLLAQRVRYHEAEAALLARVVEEGIVCGTFVAAQPQEAARLLILATNSLLPHNLTPQQLGERAEIEAKTEGLIQLMLEGLYRREDLASS